MEACISAERKHALLQELTGMRCRDKCTKRELLSLIGKLSFCCKVVPAGRIFLRRMIDLSNSVARLHHRISLTTEACLDIQWWIDFSCLRGQVPVSSSIPHGHLHQLLTSIPIPLVCTGGVRTGTGGRSSPVGHHLKAKWT